ncbi:S8 family serine peptidase, partial [candidate division WOR-3 bacterium]|nr:S8 family serine peptidase [candidate division WOR-3 bacterium]
PGHAPSPWHHPAAESGGLGGSISIGATDNNDNIASFSSWGPVTWDTIDPYFDYAYPPGLLKPDFSTPGVNITSTRRGGGYTQMSGTSMATPCAAGVCALMLEKNPNLLPEQVDEIMQNSVVPLGTQPKNNTFGTGRIDAMLCIESTPFPGPRHDVAIGAVLAPTDTIYPLEPLAPTVVVVNRGDFVETNVVVHCRVDSAGTQVYLEQFTIASLDSAGADTLEFTTWTAGGGGQTYDLTFWHVHPPDTINGNDTARAQAWSRNHDVAVVGANIGPEVRAHRPLRPAAFVGNVGGFSEAAFNVTCRVDSSGITVYDETVGVDSIPKRDTVNVIFPVWPVGPDSAVYDVTFFHDVGPDQRRANDTIEQRTRASADLIRVALELKQGSIGRTPPNAVFAIESLCNDAGWHTQIVTGTDVDELAELANFDVLVAGDPGFNDNDFNVYQHALLDWVRRGGAYVGLGWTVFGVCRKTGPWSAYDTVCAVQCTLDYAFVSHGNVSIIDTTHDITRGVADFPVQDYGEYSAAGLWPGAVMLADYTDSPGDASVAYKLLGDGRSVYLGPIYFAHFGTHENEPYFADNNARRLLRQAIRWAASGPGLGVADAPATQPLRARLAGIQPNPSDGRARVSYLLAEPCRARLAVYDLAGQLVRILVSGAQPAGERTVTWNRRDDAGRLVPAGVYFVRFEADGAVQNRKLVIR